jgi:hypothetical protein
MRLSYCASIVLIGNRLFKATLLRHDEEATEHARAGAGTVADGGAILVSIPTL